MEIRKAKLKDLKEIDEVYREGILDEEKIQFPKKSRKEILSDLDKSQKDRLNRFRTAISSGEERILVCEVNGKIVGFGGAVLSNQKRSAEITLVYLKREYRKKRIGSKIVKILLKWLKDNNERKINVTMNTKNEASINLHKKFGFKEVAIIMQKKLK